MESRSAVNIVWILIDINANSPRYENVGSELTHLFFLIRFLCLKTWRAPRFLAVHLGFFNWVHACT